MLIEFAFQHVISVTQERQTINTNVPILWMKSRG